jgi:hypothetical protein
MMKNLRLQDSTGTDVNIFVGIDKPNTYINITEVNEAVVILTPEDVLKVRDWFAARVRQLVSEGVLEDSHLSD